MTITERLAEIRARNKDIPWAADIPLLLSALEEALSALDDIRGIGSPEYAQSSLASEALAKIERLLAGTDPKSPKRCHHTRPLGSNYCPECGDEPKSPAFDVEARSVQWAANHGVPHTKRDKHAWEYDAIAREALTDHDVGEEK
jgi:hypothetical protein